jgi:hypothetical protein
MWNSPCPSEKELAFDTGWTLWPDAIGFSFSFSSLIFPTLSFRQKSIQSSWHPNFVDPDFSVIPLPPFPPWPPLIYYALFFSYDKVQKRGGKDGEGMGRGSNLQKKIHFAPVFMDKSQTY